MGKTGLTLFERMIDLQSSAGNTHDFLSNPLTTKLLPFFQLVFLNLLHMNHELAMSMSPINIFVLPFIFDKRDNPNINKLILLLILATISEA